MNITQARAHIRKHIPRSTPASGVITRAATTPQPLAPMTSVPPAGASIGVIMTVYRRPQNFTAQLAAIKAQTVQPKEILVWHNVFSEAEQPQIPLDVDYVQAVPNMGVWPRFLIGLELNTDYVCVFDDDTIPGNRWFENCLQTMKTHRGVLGTVGVVFKHETRQGRYQGDSWTRRGWPSANAQVEEADIVGHSWFFERDWLRAYAAEPRRGFSTCGEDYHLSVSAQKQLGLKTYVPPHPRGDKSLWGSLKGMELGTDDVALYKINSETDKKALTHAAYLTSGWQLICMRS